MKNVTPKAGQTWINNSTGATYQVDEADFDYIDLDSLQKHFTFQPQNDLEWLAVNEPEWKSNSIEHNICRDGDTIHYADYRYRPDSYTRDQWQNMRYDLGLDDKPQKDTKMIDLSNAKVGDEFVLSNKQVVTLRASTKQNVACEHSDGTMSLFCKDGRHDEYNHKGDVDREYDIVSKHEPRHWLKELPDADLFNDDTWFACDKVGAWFVYSEDEPEKESESWTNDGHYVQMGAKMPKLIDDEYKLSKISIPDLKAWQAANNGSK